MKSKKSKFKQIEKKLKQAIREENEEDGKLRPEEALRIQSTDLPSGDPGLTPPERD